MPSLNVPMEASAEQAALERQRQLVQAMMAKGMQQPQGQVVSGHYVAPNPLQQLAPVLMMLAGEKANAQLDQQAEGLAAKQNAQLAEGLKSYFAQRDGSPGQEMGPPDEQGGMGLTGVVAPDPRKAAISALTAAHPTLRELGKFDLQGLQKSEAETYGQPVTERGQDGKLINVQYGNRGGRRVVEGAQPYVKPLEVSGALIDPVKGVPAVDLSGRYENVTVRGADGRPDVYRRDTLTGKVEKLDNAPKVTVTNSPVIQGQKAGMEAWAKEAVKTVAELGAQARAATELQGSLDQLSKLSDSGTFNGVAATPATWLANLSQTAGLRVDANKLANSEAYASYANEAVQKLVGQYGGNRGITKEEAAQIKQIVPQLQQSPQARKQLTAILHNVAARQIDNFRKANDQLGRALSTENPTLFEFGATMLPNASPATPLPMPAAGGKTPGRSNW